MTPKQIQGYLNNLKGAVNACTNGATVELDLTTARKLVEVIDVLQAEVARLETIRKNLGDMAMLHMNMRNDAEARTTAAEEDAERLAKALDRVIDWTEWPLDRFGPIIQQAEFALAAHTQRANAKEDTQ